VDQPPQVQPLLVRSASSLPLWLLTVLVPNNCLVYLFPFPASC
jgi:hypothetical protein